MKEREETAPGHTCQQCGGPATHVRRDTLVGGGHRRNVYWCRSHDDARAMTTEDLAVQIMFDQAQTPHRLAVCIDPACAGCAWCEADE